MYFCTLQKTIRKCRCLYSNWYFRIWRQQSLDCWRRHVASPPVGEGRPSSEVGVVASFWIFVKLPETWWYCATEIQRNTIMHSPGIGFYRAVAGERPSIKWGQTTEWCLANKIGWWRVPDIVIEMTAVFQIQGKTSENTKMKQTRKHLSHRNTLTVKQH